MVEFLNSIIPNVMSKPDLLWKAVKETGLMLLYTIPIAFVLGLTLGVILIATKPDGVLRNRWIHLIVGTGRSPLSCWPLSCWR